MASASLLPQGRMRVSRPIKAMLRIVRNKRQGDQLPGGSGEIL
jgi:hypothetical protein